MKDNSQKTIVLRNKENSQSSLTPGKKSNTQSNLSNRKTCNQNGGVSYAQLQIILENVHQVKKKTSQQILTLEAKNTQLQAELLSLKEHVGKCEDYQGLLNAQKSQIEAEHLLELEQMKQKIQNEQNRYARLAEDYQSLAEELENKGKQINSLYEQIKEQQEQADILAKQKAETELNYQRMKSCLQVDEKSKELQVIKNQYGGIPQLLQTIIEAKTTIKHQNVTIEEMKNSCKQFQKHINTNDKVIETITKENESLLAMISGLGKEKQSLLCTIAQAKEQKSLALQEHNCNLTQNQSEMQSIKAVYEQKAKELKITLDLKQEQIDRLIMELDQTRKTLNQHEEKQRANMIENKFKSVVEEVCDEYTDYENVMRNTEQLQKYKNQYYFNIQKIQYLCKILDE